MHLVRCSKDRADDGRLIQTLIVRTRNGCRLEFTKGRDTLSLLRDDLVVAGGLMDSLAYLAIELGGARPPIEPEILEKLPDVSGFDRLPTPPKAL